MTGSVLVTMDVVETLFFCFAERMKEGLSLR